MSVLILLNYIIWPSSYFSVIIWFFQLLISVWLCCCWCVTNHWVAPLYGVPLWSDVTPTAGQWWMKGVLFSLCRCCSLWIRRVLMQIPVQIGKKQKSPKICKRLLWLLWKCNCRLVWDGKGQYEYQSISWRIFFKLLASK